jgi:hypothetical protein
MSTRESLYIIPDGCICMGDGLFGMSCPAATHAVLKERCAVCRQPMESVHYFCPGCDAKVCSGKCERAHRESYR